jgi:hypothetical protein
MTKVTALRGATVPTDEPNEPLIAAIKDILADAESGRLQSFVGAGFLSDGLRMSCIISNHPNVYEVIGSIEMLKHDYINGFTEKL